jgi:hypothetical protein
VEQRDSSPDSDDGTWTWKDGSAARDATISALGRVFPEVHLFKCHRSFRRFLVAWCRCAQVKMCHCFGPGSV